MPSRVRFKRLGVKAPSFSLLKNHESMSLLYADSTCKEHTFIDRIDDPYQAGLKIRS